MKIKILNTSDNPTPKLETKGAAGFDLAVSEDTVIRGASMELVPTGIRIAIPEGFEGQIRLRSSMSKKHVVMPNAPGTIDSDYRGELKVPIRNLAPYTGITLKKGERIAQLIINELPKVTLEAITIEEFGKLMTDRGDGGFGSTN
tara:strand:+ start:342 stop:776 length:435 start_codon:yes stop_codon:yes gene_type:complete